MLRSWSILATITKTNEFWDNRALPAEAAIWAKLTLSSTNQPITNSRLPPSLPTTWQDSIDHERHPQGNSSILLLCNMETPVKHQSLEAEGTCVSVREQISAGDWKQHQSPKVPACWKTELSLYKVEPDKVQSAAWIRQQRKRYSHLLWSSGERKQKVLHSKCNISNINKFS